MASLGQGRVNAIAFSPDGELLVTGEGREAGTVSIWRVADGTLLRTLDPALTPSIQSIDISPDGQQLAVGMDEQVQLFAMADGALVHTFDISGISVAYAPDGARIAIADNLPSIEIWDVATKTIVHTLPGHGFSMAYSPDGTLLAAPGWHNQGMTTFLGAENFPTTPVGDNVVQIWNAADGSANRALTEHGGQVHGIVFSPDNQFVVSGAIDSTIRLSRVADGTEVGAVKLDHMPESVAFSPDSTTVAVGVFEAIYLWPVADLVRSR